MSATCTAADDGRQHRSEWKRRKWRNRPGAEKRPRGRGELRAMPKGTVLRFDTGRFQVTGRKHHPHRFMLFGEAVDMSVLTGLPATEQERRGGEAA